MRSKHVMSDSVRVLLVEDDPAVLLGTQQTLQLAGFEVEPFADAEAAIPSIFPDVPAIVVCGVIGRPSVTIVPILHSAVSNLIHTTSSRSDMSGCRRAQLIQSRWRRNGNIAIRHLDIVLKSGVSSRSTVIRTFIALSVLVGVTYKVASFGTNCCPLTGRCRGISGQHMLNVSSSHFDPKVLQQSSTQN